MRNLLLVAILALAASGCSADYKGERLFWKAEQLNAPIVKQPKEATPAQYAKAIDAFQQVVQIAPDTLWAPRAHMAIGKLYVLQIQYEKAREVYALVLQNYNQYKDLCLAARMARAKTYEAEQNWDEAIKVYRDIMDYHAWSQSGMEAPLYIARLYEQRKMTDEATAAYERAVKAYTKLIIGAPSPDLAIHVKGYLVIAYQRLTRWEDAVKTLEDLLSITTAQGMNRPLALMTLGAIYQTKLRDVDKAQSAYAALASEFPEHPLGKAAKAQLTRLGASVSPRTSPLAPATTR